MIYDAPYAHKIRANAGIFRWRHIMFRYCRMLCYSLGLFVVRHVIYYWWPSFFA